MIWADVIVSFDPEPCHGCTVAFAYITCHDGRYRCRECVHRLATELGYFDPPAAQKRVVVKAVAPERPATLFDE